MSYAKSLRVIGQILERAQGSTFKLEKCSKHYLVWIGETLLRFDPAHIAQLDARAQKRRGAFTAPASRLPKSLSQQLRALGGLLDTIDIRSFGISWNDSAVIVEYEYVDEERNRRIFTTEQLWQLGLHRSLLRTDRHLFPRLDI